MSAMDQRLVCDEGSPRAEVQGMVTTGDVQTTQCGGRPTLMFER